MAVIVVAIVITYLKNFLGEINDLPQCTTNCTPSHSFLQLNSHFPPLYPCVGPPGRLPAGVREQFEAGDEPFRAAHGDGAWPPSPTPPNPNMPVNPSQGIRTITISIPGVLVQENTPEALSEGATVLSEAIAALLAASRQVPDVYLICQVADDIGEAAVRGALEHSRLLGPGSDQIRPQRLLFCETEVGKMSLVRQLEPKVHIDGQHSTVS